MKRRHTCNEETEEEEKRRRVAKSGSIESEKFLLDIASDISSKWEEVGVYLSLSSKTIRNELSSESGLSLSQKAFHMLLAWQERAGGDYTYTRLAEALDAAGLNTCAMRHCYIESYPTA